jgi:hypothetical protein
VRTTAALLVAVACGGANRDTADATSGASTSGAATSAGEGSTGGDADASISTSDAAGSSSAGPADDSSSGDETDDGGEGGLVVDARYPAWFMVEGGGSHFLCGPGDPEDFLFRGVENPDGTRDGDQEDLIAKIAPTGANGVYVQAVRSFGGDGDATHDPFVGHDPQAGVNEVVLDQWAGWFEALSDAGVVVYLFLYDDSAAPFGGGDEVSVAEQAFVEALVDRLEHVPLLVWVLAEEYSEAISPARAAALVQLIAATDDHEHPIGVHQLGGLAFDFADDPAVDQFTIQYNVPTAAELHDGMVQAFASADGRYNLNMSEAAMYGTGATARQKSWAVAMGGAYVMILEMDIAGTDVADLEDCGRLVEFFESTRFRETAPADALAAGDTQYVLAAPGEAYILYASAATTELGVDVEAGTYTLRWLDPVDGDTTMEQGVVAPGGPQTWPLPEGIGPEVALSIERE